MRSLTLLLIPLLAGSAVARDQRHVRNANAAKVAPDAFAASKSATHTTASPTSSVVPYSTGTAKFKVDGSALPDVSFDVGESYAGLLPISDERDAAELFFWYFPTQNPAASDEILIWLNGGPGCSSLEGLLQENGPFLWQYGTFLPVKNPWSWTELTNVVWVEQPAGTGFSRPNGTPKPKNEVEAADQFLGFWKNFVDTFGLHNRRIFITGESYAGMYVPYIASAMHNASDPTYYGVDSIQINDPVISYYALQSDIPAVPFADFWSNILYLNDTYMDTLHQLFDSCGYRTFLDEALTFPPKGKIPTPPNVNYGKPECALSNAISEAATYVNPCFDPYQVATTCPVLWDVLGFPGAFPYEPAGTTLYFNRSDVQRAIHAPPTDWAECANGVLDYDTSQFTALSVLPGVIEKNNRTVIGQGILDFVIVMNGTLVAVQNMTWHGAQGFSVAPTAWQPLYVPYHRPGPTGTLAGAGNFGLWHTERGLTFSTVQLSGHMIPQYAPTAAFRQLEFLLGRIPNLSDTAPFTAGGV